MTFDTVFPGWYAGRTVHIHFRVTVGTTEYITSQLFFDDGLNDEIIADHAKYARERGDVAREAGRRRPARVEGHQYRRLIIARRRVRKPDNRARSELRAARLAQ